METEKKKSKIGVIIAVIVFIIIIGLVIWYFAIGKDMFTKNTETVKTSDKTEKNDKTQGEEIKKVTASKYLIKDNSLGIFDLAFLKLENGKENKIYSPLSIKYTLGMLHEGAAGNTRAQIESVIGDYVPRKYHNSENISFANAFFIRNKFKSSVKTN